MNITQNVIRATRKLTNQALTLTTLAAMCCGRLHAAASGTLPWE